MSSQRDGIGMFFGIVIFLAGVVLLGYTFQQAQHLFSVPTPVALGQPAGSKDFDYNKAGDAVFQLIWKIAMLLGMCFVASVIANRGIALYRNSRDLGHPGDALKPGRRKKKSADLPEATDSNVDSEAG